MQQQEDLENWEHFEKRLEEIDADRTKQLDGDELNMYVSRFLYRGQSDHRWSLSTTLERSKRNPWSFRDYFTLAFDIARPEIETFTGSRWDIEDRESITAFASEYDSCMRALPGYEYLVYLRHHGFPSPLLDWARSPYVAAYFAFAAALTGRVAIYVYQEHVGHGKSGSSDKPQIRELGPNIRSHPRHFLQQSQYTYAAQFKENNLPDGSRTWLFTSHEDVFADGAEDQDRLWKFTIPADERSKVLKILESYNLNEFSLFQTDEALLRTVAVRVIELSGRF